MKLNIEKLIETLNNINSDINYKIDKKYFDISKKYVYVFYFNRLIHFIVEADNIKEDLESITYYSEHLTINEFNSVKKTLDFIAANEQFIKNAILENIE